MVIGRGESTYFWLYFWPAQKAAPPRIASLMRPMVLDGGYWGEMFVWKDYRFVVFVSEMCCYGSLDEVAGDVHNTR